MATGNKDDDRAAELDMHGLILLFRMSGVCLLANILASCSAPNADIAKYCRSSPARGSAGLESWIGNGTVVRYSKTKIEVDEKKWEATTQDAKVSIAVFGYCNAIAGAESDNATVIITGIHDGAQKAAIVDGNYSH